MIRRPLQPAQRPIRRAAATRALCSAAQHPHGLESFPRLALRLHAGSATVRPHAPTDDSPGVAA